MSDVPPFSDISEFKSQENFVPPSVGILACILTVVAA